MTLEDQQFLKDKNRARLRDVINSQLVLGINITTPSPFKDHLKIITIILIICTCGAIYGHVCYIIRFKNNIGIMAESICIMLHTFIAIFKLSSTVSVQHRFYSILKSIETHEFVDKIEFLSQGTPYNKILRKDARKILDNCWRIAKIQFNVYMITAILITSYYFFNAQTVNAYNWYIGNINHTNILPYPTLFPLWEDKMNKLPYYAFLTFIVGGSNLTAGISKPLSTLLRYCREFNNLYLHISLVQLLLSMVIIGVIMFQASFSLENDLMIVIRMIIYLIAAINEVVIYCFNGQLISNESENIPYAFYECEWYNESREFKQFVRMMMIRTNPIFYVKASWFSTLSLETLLALLKTSGSYFLLLQNLSN